MFLLIQRLRRFLPSCMCISIHLMFLLIRQCFIHQRLFHHFNTSHVSINQKYSKGTQSAWGISIHLMFLLIKDTKRRGKSSCKISIHLMFLLILIAVQTVVNVLHFNTSHVSINPLIDHLLLRNSLISIHLMFLLIGTSGESPGTGLLISIHLMFLLIKAFLNPLHYCIHISIHLMFLLI